MSTRTSGEFPSILCPCACYELATNTADTIGLSSSVSHRPTTTRTCPCCASCEYSRRILEKELPSQASGTSSLLLGWNGARLPRRCRGSSRKTRQSGSGLPLLGLPRRRRKARSQRSRRTDLVSKSTRRPGEDTATKWSSDNVDSREDWSLPGLSSNEM